MILSSYYPLSVKKILFTKKKKTIEKTPIKKVVPMFYIKSGTSRPATATHTLFSSCAGRKILASGLAT